MNSSTNSFIREKREATRKLLAEIKEKSGRTWSDLSIMLEVDLPKNNYSYERLKKCASKNSTVYLHENEMIRIAQWAISKKFGGDVCTKISQHIELDDDDVELNKHIRRNANENIDWKRQDDLISMQKNRRKKAEKKATLQLKASLDEVCRAGFSPAEVLYMTYSWLSLNYKKLSQEIVLPGVVEVGDPNFRFVDPSMLPPTLVLPTYGSDSDELMIDVLISKVISD